MHVLFLGGLAMHLSVRRRCGKIRLTSCNGGCCELNIRFFVLMLFFHGLLTDCCCKHSLAVVVVFVVVLVVVVNSCSFSCSVL